MSRPHAFSAAACGAMLAFVLSAGPATAVPPRLTGLEQLTQLQWLPLLHPDVRVHYAGSIDKRGGNADWDWWLYQDGRTQEWVLMEVQGPGCLWNFVVHHAVGHSDLAHAVLAFGPD